MTNKLRAIIEKKGPIKTIGVLGMGFVGIPSAAVYANSRAFDFVWGFQRNSLASGYKIDLLNRGQSPILGKEPGLNGLLRKVVRDGKFRCTSDFAKLSEVDAVTIAVETSINNTEDLTPDNNNLEESLRIVGRHLTKGLLVVIESTVSPGTTEGLAREILEEESGLKAGVDFALAHAPERVMPGRLLRNIREYDRIVGGIDEVSTARAKELYAPILTKGKIITMTAKAAEMTKTAENALRDLQIAAANQLALYCEALGIDFYDVWAGIDSLKGEGVTRAILLPGAGVGGHCLTKDTYLLERGLKNLDQKFNFPSLQESLFMMARKINDFMPRHMYRLTLSALKKAGKDLKNSRVAILGWAFNKNTSDSRNTPAQPYRDLLMKEGMDVRVHDPYSNNHQGLQVFLDLDETLRDSDVMAVITAHDVYKKLDLDKARKLMRGSLPIIVDGRNIVNAEKAIQKGFIYMGIGRGDLNKIPHPAT